MQGNELKGNELKGHCRNLSEKDGALHQGGTSACGEKQPDSGSTWKVVQVGFVNGPVVRYQSKETVKDYTKALGLIN